MSSHWEWSERVVNSYGSSHKKPMDQPWLDNSSQKQRKRCYPSHGDDSKGFYVRRAIILFPPHQWSFTCFSNNKIPTLDCWNRFHSVFSGGSYSQELAFNWKNIKMIIGSLSSKKRLCLFVGFLGESGLRFESKPYYFGHWPPKGEACWPQNNTNLVRKTLYTPWTHRTNR